jgi:hypothetical protein
MMRGDGGEDGYMTIQIFQDINSTTDRFYMDPGHYSITAHALAWGSSTLQTLAATIKHGSMQRRRSSRTPCNGLSARPPLSAKFPM